MYAIGKYGNCDEVRTVMRRYECGCIYDRQRAPYTTRRASSFGDLVVVPPDDATREVGPMGPLYIYIEHTPILIYGRHVVDAHTAILVVDKHLASPPKGCRVVFKLVEHNLIPVVADHRRCITELDILGGCIHIAMVILPCNMRSTARRRTHSDSECMHGRSTQTYPCLLFVQHI